MVEAKNDITRLLKLSREGEEGAWSQLMRLVFDELHAIAEARLARLRPGQTIQATDLVSEAYLRLLRTRGEVDWSHRGHFLAVASLVMRDVLVDQARRRLRRKRGGAWRKVTLAVDLVGAQARDEDLVALDEALGRLKAMEPRQHEVVMLKFFGGLEIDDIARALDVSPSTVDREWRFARAWLHRELARERRSP
ncbi:MAG: sigma-70 family RNA polymerase sigma factor [Planctomycetes bacterium]|nr:sigma-70 family RNA polymerase sigma factor [Planctomycetota bacterium]